MRRAKDSFGDLLELKAEKQREERKTLLLSSDVLALAFDESLPFWESGDDWRPSERKLPLKDYQEDFMEFGGACTDPPCCLTPPWRNRPTPMIVPLDDDDDNELTNGTESSLLKDHYRKTQYLATRSGGIVRRASIAVQAWMGGPSSRRQSYHPKTYEPQSTSFSTPKHVRFAPKANAVTIRPWQLMEDVTKRSIWWQREDFDGFKQQMALLVQDKDTKDFAIWLNSNTGKSKTAGFAGHKDDESSALNTSESSAYREWWHKYEHSRRGLEKYASSRQAQQILNSYRTALNVVLEEQQRQYFTCQRDPDRIAELYHEYTAWSRDLALAAAASDEDAVRTDFDDSKRKSREYFLLKQIYKSDNMVHKHMPQFMIPAGIRPKGYLTETL